MSPSRRKGESRRDPGRRRAALVAYLAVCVLLVALAFLRAHLSSTGIRVTGDGLDYRELAAGLAGSGELAGRAPFVHRPLVPLLVAALPGPPLAGFVGLTAVSLLAALMLLWPASRDGRVAFVLAPVLLIDYQVLFAAANPARLDAFILAVQLGFVVLAAWGERRWFFLLMAPTALVKETLVLALLPLGLAAFPADRRTGRMAVASTAGFLGLHLAVRAVATVQGSATAYEAGWLDPAGALDLLARNLGPALPLVALAALGGLLVPGLLVMARACRGAAGGWIAALLALDLALPLAAAVDVHRAWFELALPLAAWGLLRALQGGDGRRLATFGGLALAAGLLPYGTVLLGTEHLYLESVRALAAGGLPPAITLVPAAAALALSAAAAWTITRAKPRDPASGRGAPGGIIDS